MAQYYVNIDNYPIGALSSSDWSFRQNNGGASAVVLSSAGRNLIRTDATAAGTKVMAYTPLNNVNDVEALIKFRLASDFGKQGIVSLRYGGNTEANTTGYTLSGSVIGSVGTLAIDEGSTGYVAWTPWNYLANTTYWVRFRVIGNSLRAKVWTDGTAEPSTWALDVTNSAATTGSFSGFHQYRSESIFYLHASFATDGDPAPMFVQKSLDYSANADIAPPIPTSTPMGVFGAGYGAPMGYGGMYGAGVIPAFTVEHQDYTANAFIDKKRALTYASNALIVYLKNSTYTANAFIDKQNKLNSTSNAFIDWKLSLAYQANARIERIESLGYTSNADIDSYYFTSSVDYTSNARIEKTYAADYQANAFIDQQRSITHTANAFIDWQDSVGYNANAFVEKQHQLDYTANALIDYRYAVDYDANAFIEWQLSQTYAANAFIEHVRSLGHAANARIERQGEYVDYEANARIERIEGLSYAANASISNPVPDKKPQTWENADTREPTDWSADDKAPTTWNEAEERQPAEWQKANESQPQQWSDSNNKKSTDWSPIYYD